MSEEKSRVLFVCAHNSARSQMAEGMLRELGGDRSEAFSAGTEATRMRPLAVHREVRDAIRQHIERELLGRVP